MTLLLTEEDRLKHKIEALIGVKITTAPSEAVLTNCLNDIEKAKKKRSNNEQKEK